MTSTSARRASGAAWNGGAPNTTTSRTRNVRKPGQTPPTVVRCPVAAVSARSTAGTASVRHSNQPPVTRIAIPAPIASHNRREGRRRTL